MQNTQGIQGGGFASAAVAAAQALSLARSYPLLLQRKMCACCANIRVGMKHVVRPAVDHVCALHCVLYACVCVYARGKLRKKKV